MEGQPVSGIEIAAFVCAAALVLTIVFGAVL